MRIPAKAKGCEPCRSLYFYVTGSRSEVARARTRLRKHALGDLASRYVAETKAAVENVRYAETRYLAHHAEAHPLPNIVLSGTDNDRAPSHRKPAIPPAADLAARIRAGESLEAVAASYDRTAKSIGRRLTMAGFVSTTGEERTRRRDEDGIMVTTRPWDTRPWLDDALCAQADPEAWFPDRGGSTREAKAICNGNPKRGITPCPVRAECLDDALATNDRYGIRGGLSERERRALKRKAS